MVVSGAVHTWFSGEGRHVVSGLNPWEEGGLVDSDADRQPFHGCGKVLIINLPRPEEIHAVEDRTVAEPLVTEGVGASHLKFLMFKGIRSVEVQIELEASFAPVPMFSVAVNVGIRTPLLFNWF